MIGECKMKKICFLLLVLCLIFSLSACGDNDNSTQNTDNDSFCVECGGEISSTDKFCGSCGTSVNKTNSTPTTTTKPEISVEPAMTEDKLLSQIDAQELKVVKTKYVVQDEKYKAL